MRRGDSEGDGKVKVRIQESGPRQGKAKRVSILRSVPCDKEASFPDPGVVCGVDAESFSVSCSGGALRILELQREGKPAMDTAAYMRGNPVEPGDRFEETLEKGS